MGIDFAEFLVSGKRSCQMLRVDESTSNVERMFVSNLVGDGVTDEFSLPRGMIIYESGFQSENEKYDFNDIFPIDFVSRVILGTKKSTSLIDASNAHVNIAITIAFYVS